MIARSARPVTIAAAMTIVTRFAPSPTGFLHMGHAYSAFAGWHAARMAGGLFLLRVEDIDTGRCRPHFEDAIYEDLAWLGLTWERPVRRQSEHLPDYRAALAALESLGVVYPCFCTRKAIQQEVARMSRAPHGPDGALYPGTCRNLPQAERDQRIGDGNAYALRLDSARAASVIGEATWLDELAGPQRVMPALFGDVVLARRDVPTSYHLSVTVDDHLQDITLVTRGEDLFHATHVHRTLQILLGYKAPIYRHHRLITDDAGQRLAKRSDAMSIRHHRAAGMAPGEIWSSIGVSDMP